MQEHKSPISIESSSQSSSFPMRVFRFYVQGFRSMTWGRTMWMIILLKLFIMFAVLKLFFFPNFLAQKGDQEARQRYVLEQLTDRKSPLQGDKMGVVK